MSVHREGRYALYKYESGHYLKLCAVYPSYWDAIAEAEWEEEHGRGSFAVVKVEERGAYFNV